MLSKNTFNEKNFLNPKRTFRPIAFWAWSGEIKNDEILRQLVLMKGQKIGAAMIYPRYGLITPYLSKEYLDRVRFTVETAEKLNLDIWLYDEFCFPSGTANREVVKNNKFKKKYLRCSCKNVQGELKVVSFNIMEDNGKNVGTVTMEGRYVDTLNPKAIKKFIQLTYDKYYQILGEYFGKTVKGIFTDEPSLGYYWGHWTEKQGSENNPIIDLPWTEKLPMIFKKKKGYDLKKILPDFFGNSEDSAKYRQDFQEICTNLLEKAYHRQISDWCRQHKIQYAGHLLGEEPTGFLILCNGDYFTQARNFHVPGIDEIHTRTSLKEKGVEVIAPKMAQSTAEQIGVKRTMVELYAVGPSEITMNKMKRMINYESVLGLNTFLLAICPYSLAGNTITNYFSTLFYQQPWFKYMYLYSEYVGRLSYLLTRGKRIAAVGIVFPIKSYWRRNNIDLDKNTVWEKQEKSLPEIGKTLLEEHIDFGFLWETNLDNVRIRDGEIIVGENRFKTLILPLVEKLTEEMDLFLEKFSASGGKVIRINSIDKRCLKRLLSVQIKDRDVEIKKEKKAVPQILYQHRSTVNEEIYFFANTEMTKLKKVEIIFRNLKQSIPFKINLDDGKLLPIKYMREKDTLKIYSDFEKGEGFGIIFTDNKSKTVKDTYYDKEFKKEVLTLGGEWPFAIQRKNSLRFKGWQNQSKSSKVTEFFVKDLPENISFSYQENSVKKVKINGKVLSTQVKKNYYLDESYLETDIREYLVKGKNTVLIETNQKTDLPFRPLGLIIGDFSVCANIIVKPINKIKTGTWVKQGYPEYTGTGVYKKEFCLPQKRPDAEYILKVDVGDDIAELKLNGKLVGIRAWEPYQYNLTPFIQKGLNALEIAVTNTVRNMLGDFGEDVKKNLWIPTETKPCGLLKSPKIYEEVHDD